ncbi:THAP domain-containing protein 5-like [Myripristis murdjan]|uniref:THAP domain-containing protein 5-like n=1 Tax=Myripristis murdjan TaxID=586833 RepID=UPI001175D1C5|nr:THAP domain-containing protein 5-like [Myripristis murdjan]
MPKYCSAPSCKNDSGNNSDRKSFYKFPLHHPDRLQQWLKNMGRENWVPSQHQYICHEHFTASCFKVRWGIRYLENDAVPTLFQGPEKRRGVDHSEKKPKRPRGNGNLSITVSGDGTLAADAVELDSSIGMVQLYETTIDTSQPGETVLVESSDATDSLQTDLNPPASVSGFAGEGQEELLSGITAAIITQGPRLVVSDSTPNHTEETLGSPGVCEDVISTVEEPALFHSDHEAQVIAYFETIPNVLPSGTSVQFAVPSDTVLSSALDSKPIASTLPIVSKHVPPPPASLVLTMERLGAEHAEGDGSGSGEDGPERNDHKLEEHCYHKNSLSKEQLEAIVAELQKKVKVLQQRHRRHLEKLLSLENTVSQLRQNNLLNEERLQLLERAYIETSAAVSEAGETVAIIYEEDNTAYLYTPLNDGEEEM